MRPQRCWGATGIFQHLWGFGLACTRAHGSCYNQSVRAVAYPNTVCGSLQPDAGQGAPVSLVPPWQHYSHNSPQLARRRGLKRSAFEHRTANAADPLGRRGSNVYEVNPWLWQFGRGKQRLGYSLCLQLRIGAKWCAVTGQSRQWPHAAAARLPGGRGEWTQWQVCQWLDRKGYPFFENVILTYPGTSKYKWLIPKQFTDKTKQVSYSSVKQG